MNERHKPQAAAAYFIAIECHHFQMLFSRSYVFVLQFKTIINISSS